MRASVFFATLPLWALCAVGQEPAPAPDAAATTPPAPATAPAAPVAPVPVAPPGAPAPAAPAVVTPDLFVDPGQGIYGAIIEATPAYRIAALEAGQSLADNDPLIYRASVLLSQNTAVFVEDAPRIAELTINAVKVIRAHNRPATPFEILEAAPRWPRSPGTRTDLPRQYENYAALYRVWRVWGRKDHAQAMSSMKIPPAPAAGAPGKSS